MPAVTVENILSLPKIEGTEGSERPVLSLTQAPSGVEGEGFPVRRAFAGVDLARLDPFVHMDQMGEVNYAPGEPKGTPWHPHRGFETVTYMIDGTFQHQDSAGGGGVITNGDTQWMTAGAGILHIEAPPEALGHERRPVPRDPALGQPAGGRQVGAAALSGHPQRRGGAGGVARRRGAGPGHRRPGGRPRRPRVDPHPHGHGPRHGERRGPTGAALAAGIQRPRLRPGRPGHASERQGAAVATGTMVVFGDGDNLVVTADSRAGRGHTRSRGSRPRGPAHRRTGGRLRALRHEHPVRDRPGLRGLREGKARDHPGRPHRPLTARADAPPSGADVGQEGTLARLTGRVCVIAGAAGVIGEAAAGGRIVIGIGAITTAFTVPS